MQLSWNLCIHGSTDNITLYSNSFKQIIHFLYSSDRLGWSLNSNFVTVNSSLF